MDLAIYAYGISVGFISSILSILGNRFFLKKPLPLLRKWILSGILSLGLGALFGGIYFSIDVGEVPGVENPIGLAILVSSLSGALFTVIIGLIRGLIFLLSQKKI